MQKVVQVVECLPSKHEALSSTPSTTQKRIYPFHIIVKMPRFQNKDRILKGAREKYQLTFKVKTIRIISDLSAETLKIRKA
jgi:hypothetical protein